MATLFETQKAETSPPRHWEAERQRIANREALVQAITAAPAQKAETTVRQKVELDPRVNALKLPVRSAELLTLVVRADEAAPPGDRVRFTTTDAAYLMGCEPQVAGEARKDLIARGFLKVIDTGNGDVSYSPRLR